VPFPGEQQVHNENRYAKGGYLCKTTLAATAMSEYEAFTTIIKGMMGSSAAGAPPGHSWAIVSIPHRQSRQQRQFCRKPELNDRF
jgi:hypothetical protein